MVAEHNPEGVRVEMGVRILQLDLPLLYRHLLANSSKSVLTAISPNVATSSSSEFRTWLGREDAICATPTLAALSCRC